MVRKLKIVSVTAVRLVFVLFLAWQLIPRWQIAEGYSKPEKWNQYLKVKNDPLLKIPSSDDVTIREVDIGYARFSLPEKIRRSSEIYYYDDGLVSIESRELSLVFLPPDNELLNSTVLPLIQAFEDQKRGQTKILPKRYFNSDDRLENMAMFDLQMVLGTHASVSFWESFFMWPAELSELVTALMMRLAIYELLPGGTFKISPFHTDELVGVIYFGQHAGRIHLSSHDRKVHQDISFKTSVSNEGILSDELKVLLSTFSYASNKCCFTAEEIIKLAEAKNISKYQE